MILAAGRGERMRPLTLVRPKPRQSGATTQRLASPARAMASTTNWNDAPTSMKPCTITSSGTPGCGVPHWCRW